MSTEPQELPYRATGLARMAGLAVAYGLLARLVLTVSSANGNVTIFWLPGGIALAALLVWGRHFWPGVFAGAVAAGLMVNDPPLASLLIALGNTLESIAAAWLLQRSPRFDSALKKPFDFAFLFLIAALCAPLSALIGPAALWFAGYLAGPTVPHNMLYWWQADVLGIVLGTPLALVWRQPTQNWFQRGRWLESLLLLILAFLFGQAIFLDWFAAYAGPFKLGYWMFLFAVWAAVRRGLHGVSLLLVMAATQALLGAIEGKGFFGQDLALTGLQNFWFYTLALATVGISLAISLSRQKQMRLALQESEELQRLFIEHAPASLAMFDRDMRYLAVSRRWKENYQLVERDILGHSHYEIFPELPERWKAAHRRGLAGEVVRAEEDFFEWPDGTRLWARWEVRPWLDNAGNIGGIVIVTEDITAQKRAQESERLAALVYEHTSEAMLVTDADGTILAINPAFTQITGYGKEEAIGRNPRILNSGRHDNAFYQAMWNAINTTGRWQGEIWNRRKNGEIYVEELSINTVFREDGAPWRRVGLFWDITQKKNWEELLWHQANYDPLTDLPNRRLFHDRLQQEIKKSHRSGLPLAVMLLDLDRFKDVNDSLGHQTGDELLREAAMRLKACIRDTDTVARLGGDEFSLILGELDDTGIVERVAHCLLESLSQPYALGGENAIISTSIGITLFPDDADNAPALLQNADQAMYAAKSQGRNRFSYFTRSMQETAEHRLHLVNDLRVALPQRQLALYYQPIVELASGTVGKAEALIRWQHPERGFISPADFIPLAEDSGLIHEIGDWVFHQAAEQVKRWRDTLHPHFQISINKSPLQFRDSARHSDWMAHLQQLQLPGESLAVEITEGLLMDAKETTRDKLLEFRDAGIQVAIDDFGTGYSTLSYLKKFDIDYLKIDQSFVRSLALESSDLALCEAIVVMAHKLGLKVIAEGVETQAQRDLLKEIGCDFGQGYLFAKPLPAQAFEKWLGERRL